MSDWIMDMDRAMDEHPEWFPDYQSIEQEVSGTSEWIHRSYVDPLGVYYHGRLTPRRIMSIPVDHTYRLRAVRRIINVIAALGLGVIVLVIIGSLQP